MAAIQHYRKLSAADTNAVLIKTGRRHLRKVEAFSIDATPVYIKFYDKATAATEADTPKYTLVVPAPATAANGNREDALFPDPGLPFELGLAVRMVTGFADNDTGALSANEVLLNVEYD